MLGRSSHSVYHCSFYNPPLVSNPLSLKALYGHREPIGYGIKILRGTQLNLLVLATQAKVMGNIPHSDASIRVPRYFGIDEIPTNLAKDATAYSKT